MSGLPEGWVRATLHDLGTEARPGFASGKHNRDGNGVLHLRPMNITRGGKIETSDARFISDDTDRRLADGDVLFNNTNSPPLVGKTAYIAAGEGFAYSNHMTRLRPPSGVDGRFLALQLHHLWAQGHFISVLSHHVNQASVGVKVLLQTEVALPPLAEQRRIVAALEDHLSRLDAAGVELAASRTRLARLTKRVLVEAVPIPTPAHWKLVTVKEAGTVELGRQRHPDWHTGSHMRPYLRVANVFEDHIDTGDLKEMDFPPEMFERYKLHPGDILLNEGQTPELLGRPAMYRGEPKDIAFQKTLLRFQSGPNVLPEWALLVFRRHLHAGWFRREVRITTNIAHLTAVRLKEVDFPIPPIDEQAEIVKRVQDQIDGISRLSAAIESVRTRATHLRQSLLREAFAGRLVPQDPADEPASTLLDGIRAERAATGKAKTPRTRRKPPAHAPTPASGFVQETLL